MWSRIIATLTGVAVTLFIGLTSVVTATAAQEKPKIVKVVPPDIRANNPQAMFREYCAACHGPEGKGNGPAAPALKTTPADLTKISARNGGTFPVAKIRRYIQGLDELPAHGSRDMPIWGELFRGLVGGEAAAQLRVQQLIEYLQKMQQ